MGGIGGLAGYKTGAVAIASVCDGMLAQLKRRGSDDHGTFISEQACLVYTGTDKRHNTKGPLRAVMGTKAYVFVYDGEVYNKDELSLELRSLGYRLPDTDCGTIILYGYLAWGLSIVDKLMGMYTFTVWDGEKLFAARDRLGLKPFYYAVGAYGLVFASDIKTILAHPEVQAVIDREGLSEILLLGPGRTPGCGVFKNIKELKPGHTMTYSSMSGVEINSYWQLTARPHRESFEETAENIRNLLKDAITRQTPRGISIGTLLSGGLDSSAIATLSGTKETFSVDYIGNDKHFTPNDFQPEGDNEYINAMVSFLRLKHKRIVFGTDELADALVPAMDARGLPGMADVDSSLLLFCKQVRQSVKFALSGEGADEIFGGYPWYKDEARLFEKGFPWSGSMDYRTSFIRPDLLDKLDPKAFIDERYLQTVSQAEGLYDDDPKEKRVRQMFLLNVNWFLQTLAARNDSMSALAGLTIRTPFLDHRLVEYLYNVPWEYKNHNEREKGLLRFALQGLLPDTVLWRKKSPYPKTHNPAYLTRVSDMLKAILSDGSSPIFELVTKGALTKLLDSSQVMPWYGQLMTHPQTIAYFLQFDAWLKDYGVILKL